MQPSPSQNRIDQLASQLNTLRAELDGTPVGAAVFGARTLAHELTDSFARRVAAERPDLLPPACANLDAILWARGMFRSRCFPRSLLPSMSDHDEPASADTDAGTEAADGVMLPLFDLLNHSHAQAQLACV